VPAVCPLRPVGRTLLHAIQPETPFGDLCDEAFTLLAGIAQFFKQTEPQSPVPYLIERAIKWGNLPLEGWLNDVIKDSNVVDNIRDVLGTKGSCP